MAKASASTLINRTRTRGQKTSIPRIAEVSPALICAEVQAHGLWFISHTKLQSLFIDACDAIGAKPNADYEGVVLPLMRNRIAAGVSQRKTKGDVPEGYTYSVEANAQRGRYSGIMVTLVSETDED